METIKLSVCVNGHEITQEYSTNDSGKFGKIGEIAIKMLFNGMRGNATRVSAKGHNDFTHKGEIYEVKSNCGTFGKNDTKAKYIVYSYDNESEYNKPQQWKVIPMNEFVNGASALGMLREKTTTDGNKAIGIQSYKNSHKKTSEWTTFIDQYPTTLEWLNR